MVIDSINKTSASVYLLELSDLWHARLGHLEVLPDFKCDKSKCEICVESKLVKHPYKSVERNSKTLDLIHTDICDMKSTPSRGGKNNIL